MRIPGARSAALIKIGHKECTKCLKDLPLTEFYKIQRAKATWTEFTSRCKKCHTDQIVESNKRMRHAKSAAKKSTQSENTNTRIHPGSS